MASVSKSPSVESIELRLRNLKSTEDPQPSTSNVARQKADTSMPRNQIHGLYVFPPNNKVPPTSKASAPEMPNSTSTPIPADAEQVPKKSIITDATSDRTSKRSISTDTGDDERLERMRQQANREEAIAHLEAPKMVESLCNALLQSLPSYKLSKCKGGSKCPHLGPNQYYHCELIVKGNKRLASKIPSQYLKLEGSFSGVNISKRLAMMTAARNALAIWDDNDLIRIGDKKFSEYVRDISYECDPV